MTTPRRPTSETHAGAADGYWLLRAARLVEAADRQDPLALSRLDALIVELTASGHPAEDLLPLRVAYAERQWLPRKAPVILRPNRALLIDAQRAGWSSTTLEFVRLLAAVEHLCDVAGRLPRRAEAEAEVLRSARAALRCLGPHASESATRRFVRLLTDVLDDLRTLRDALAAARSAELPSRFEACLWYAGRAANAEREARRLLG